ncbi:hypothetical protein PENSPDRAFT_686826 [Peniophora sp. CONT]|nr:hypothetical protein PENSPDRAFT_686826 [Peniophora sp. CONT]
MSRTTVKIDFGKSLTIEPLLDDESNWTTFEEDFKTACDARETSKYLTGSYVEPTRFSYNSTLRKYFKLDEDGDVTTEELTRAEALACEPAIAIFDREQAQLREMLRQSIPTSLWMQVKESGLFDDIWNELDRLCSDKQVGTVDAIDRQMLAVRCPDDEDPGATITLLLRLRDQLASMGKQLTDAEMVQRYRGAFQEYRLELQAHENVFRGMRMKETDEAKRALIIMTAKDAIGVIRKSWGP